MFQGGNLALGAFPAAAYATGNAASSTVTLDDIGGDYRGRAIRQMVAEGKVPADFDFTDYRAHHAGPPGSMEIEFVHKDYHGKVGHEGTGKSVRVPKKTAPDVTSCDPTPKTSTKVKNLARSVKIHGLFIIEVIDTAKTAYEFSGAGGATPLMETVRFTDESGDQFTVTNSFWNGWQKHYVSGKQSGVNVPISASDRQKLQKVVEDLYGKLEWKSTGYFGGYWKFTPGVDSPNRLPIYKKLNPWDSEYEAYQLGFREQIGYVDETGEHYFSVPQRNVEGICFPNIS